MMHTVTAAASHDPDGDGSGPVHNQSGYRPALTRTPEKPRMPLVRPRGRPRLHACEDEVPWGHPSRWFR